MFRYACLVEILTDTSKGLSSAWAGWDIMMIMILQH